MVIALRRLNPLGSLFLAFFCITLRTPTIAEILKPLDSLSPLPPPLKEPRSTVAISESVGGEDGSFTADSGEIGSPQKLPSFYITLSA